MAGSSSTRKAAKLAQRGKGRKVRFQGGTVFPAVVALVLVLGVGLITYLRATLPAADESPPTIEDHWHAAYGFYLCDSWYKLSGALEERDSRGQFVDTRFNRTGIHSHDDGVMHWHPFTSASVGLNAVIDVFFETYGVALENDSIDFGDNVLVPFTAAGTAPVEQTYVEGETKCNGEDAEISVKAWDQYDDSDGSGKRYIAEMGRVHLDQDGMAFGIYFAPKDTEQTKPPSAAELPELGVADQAQERPEVTLAPGETAPSTVPGDSATADSVTGTDSAPTATDATSAPTTTGG